ncbi:Microtubule-nucleating Tub4p (gamma-tubulin) complex component [Pichia californica]|uniref:Spindle pole body component n=1 Tax=Pichia californica TaxID=460514 RepID=A0A9P6WNR5_9ASCO|nr:Microtubule-nucleating Tub4p (gamma-tubulin) complex component [[Candida] californica]KAG0690477.1 Microtubule-nucleating Tub4p (gamma-tubulin) complex component [[Candida] californica]
MSLAAALTRYEHEQQKQHNLSALVSESTIVSDLKYLLLGTGSSSFRFSSDKSSSSSLRVEITLDTDSLLPNQIGYLKDFIQLALIIKKLSIISSNNTNINNNQQVNRSSLIAFHSCISESLLNFQCFLNDLYNNNNNNNINHLSSLKYHLDDWFVSFRHIYWLHLKSLSLKPYDFLSLLYQYTLFGDSVIKNLSLKYFNSCFNPYYNIIFNWSLLGILNENDSLNESFFIKLNENKNDFSFILNYIPSFINQNIAFKIYHIGKSINYLKHHLNDKLWCNNFYSQQQYQHLDIINDENNNKIILNLYNIIITHLNSLLLKDYKSEISNLNNFLLLNQGDLIHSIISTGSLILNQPSENLSSNQLITLLQDSIDSTSISKNYSFKIYNRLDARLLNLNLNSNSSLGWDLFTLDFKIIDSINYLISSTYKEYLKIFNFLFKILKLKYQLSESWKKSRLLTINKLKLNSKSKINLNLKIKSHQRKFELIRHQFTSFIDSIYFYISNEILLINYNNFEKKFKSNFDKLYNLENNKLLPFNLKKDSLFNLDDLKLIHDNYIYSISKSELFYNFDNSKIPINRILYQLILIIDKFIQLQSEFQSTLIDLLKIEELKILDSNSELDQYKSFLFDKINKIFGKLGTIIVDPYENDLTLFIRLLKSTNNESLKCLGQILEN